MKRIGFLYDRLLDKTFIKQTIQKASKHKTKRKAVQRVLENIDKYVNLIYNMLANDKIILRPTHKKEIHERGKTRIITISPFFPNQILDYLAVELTKDIIRKPMYQYCVGNVDKRGIVYGKNVVKKAQKKYKYFMKLDIRHFYQNVKPELLIKMFVRKIKDKRFINFLEQLICENELPIGCYYSQWFSNFFLTDFDHYIKEQCGCNFYIRYVDDMALGGNNKRRLMNIYYKAKSYIMNISLEFKYFPIIRTFINFLGFVFKNNIVKLRHKIFYRIKKTIKGIKEHLCFSLAQRIMSYFSWLKQIESGYNYYINNIFPIIKLGKLKSIMSNGGI